MVIRGAIFLTILLAWNVSIARPISEMFPKIRSGSVELVNNSTVCEVVGERGEEANFSTTLSYVFYAKDGLPAKQVCELALAYILGRIPGSYDPAMPAIKLPPLPSGKIMDQAGRRPRVSAAQCADYMRQLDKFMAVCMQGIDNGTIPKSQCTPGWQAFDARPADCEFSILKNNRQAASPPANGQSAATGAPAHGRKGDDAARAKVLGEQCISLIDAGNVPPNGWVHYYRNSCQLIFEIDVACPGKTRQPNTQLTPTGSFADKRAAFSNCPSPGRPAVWFKSVRNVD